MPIEFRCTSCDKLLRVKEEAAGKKAKCPQCQTLLTIPAATPAPEPADEYALAGVGAPSAGPSVSARPPGDQNPFQAPQTREASPFAASPVAGRTPVTPTRIDMGDMFARTWTIFKQNMGLLIGAIVVAWLVSTMGGFGIGFVGGFVGALLGPLGIVVMLAAMLAQNLFGIWITAGQTLLFIKAARGERAELGDLFAGGPFLWRFLGVFLLFMLIVMAGTFVLIVPGIILAMMFYPALYLVIDQKQGVSDSFSTASSITKGNKLTIFGTFVVLSLLGGLLIVVTLGFGILFVMPYMQLLGTVMYLSMAGQRTAAG